MYVWIIMDHNLWSKSVFHSCIIYDTFRFSKGFPVMIGATYTLNL